MNDDRTLAASNLDTDELYERFDSAGMGRAIAELPAQAREAWAAAQAWPLPDSLRTPRRVVALGMGGSAIGADVVSTLTAHWRAVPVQVVRGYSAPAVDEDTLVVACSFSGGTEETLEAFEGTLGGPGMRLAITSGGRLAELAREHNVPLFTYQYQGQPRAALGYAMFPLLAILQRLGAVAVEESTVEAAIASLEQARGQWGRDIAEEHNEAKRIARGLYGTLPVAFGPDILEVAARRWSTQIAENAKQWGLFLALPELNHNLMVGLGLPANLGSLVHVLLLDGGVVHRRNRLRVRLTAEALERAGVPNQTLDAGGSEALESVLRAIYLGDWVSLYLALLNGEEPSPVAPIDRLKRDLAAER